MLGKVGQGLYVILSNFNHERWMVAATSLGAQRVVVEECLKSVLIVSLPKFGVDYPDQVDQSTHRFQEATSLSSRHTRQTCADD